MKFSSSNSNLSQHAKSQFQYQHFILHINSQSAAQHQASLQKFLGCLISFPTIQNRKCYTPRKNCRLNLIWDFVKGLMSNTSHLWKLAFRDTTNICLDFEDLRSICYFRVSILWD